MPARPDAPNVLKVEFLWSLGGLPAANIQYVLYSGTAPTAAACAAIANQLGTAWWDVIQAFYPTVYEFAAVVVTDLTTSTGASGSHSFGSPGTGSGNPLPINACILVDHTISRRYRGGHPRTYYPPLESNYYQEPSTWTGAGVTAVGNAQAAFALEASTFSDSGCTGVYVVNVSYISGGVARVAPVIDQITGSTVSGIIRTQRRRLTSSTY